MVGGARSWSFSGVGPGVVFMFNGNGEVRTGTLFTGSFCAYRNHGFWRRRTIVPFGFIVHIQRERGKITILPSGWGYVPAGHGSTSICGSDDGIFPTSTEGFDV